jgi:hypothetical protein
MEPSQLTWEGINQWLLFRVTTEPPTTHFARLAWMSWISEPRFVIS